MEPDGVIRKLAAIFSADVKDYSLLMREDEVDTVRTLTSYRELITTLIKQYRGRVVDSPGDNILAEFPSVVDAVQGAVSIQKELEAKNAKIAENRRMEFRIGINLGDVIVEGDRIYGDGVNLAARLEGLADPGGICISRTSFDQIKDKLPFGYEYLGEKTVKNTPKPVRAYKVLLEPDKTAPKKHKEKKSNGIRVNKRPKHRLKEIRIEHNGMLKDGFSKHLITYIGVIGFLFIINMLTDRRELWFYWPALGWGLFIYLHWLKSSDRFSNKFYKHLFRYLGVIGFLFIINMITSSGEIWFHWPALGWGLLLFFHWLRKQ